MAGFRLPLGGEMPEPRPACKTGLGGLSWFVWRFAVVSTDSDYNDMLSAGAFSKFEGSRVACPRRGNNAARQSMFHAGTCSISARLAWPK
jgi:hypothetical protein